MSQNPYDDFKRQWIARRNRPNTASDIDHILNDNINCSPPNVSFRHLRWIRGTQTIELLNAAGEHITQLTHSQARRLNSLGWLRSDLPVIVRNETFADSAASSNPTTATYTLNQVLNHIEDNTPPPPSSTLISDAHEADPPLPSSTFALTVYEPTSTPEEFQRASGPVPSTVPPVAV